MVTTRRRFIAGCAALAGCAVLPGGNMSAASPPPEDRTPADPPEGAPIDKPGDTPIDEPGDTPIERPGRTPNTHFAVNLEMWFRGSFLDRITKAAELGFPAVEFWPYQGKDIEGMARLLGKLGLTASQFTAWGFGKELNHPDAPADRFLEAIEESCAVAAKLPGCEMFTVVAGDDIEGVSKARMHAAVVEKLKKAVPILEEHRKMVILEPMNPYNHPGHCLYGSKDGIAIVEAVGSRWVKLNWDLFHMQRYEGNLIDNLRKGKASIGYVQLADSPDRNEPGTGEVNYTQVLKAVKEIGYAYPVGLECTPQGGDVVRAARRIHAADSWT